MSDDRTAAKDAFDEHGGEEPHVRAFALLARFLDQHSLSDAGELDRLIEAHPAERTALREILRNFDAIRDAKRESAAGGGEEIPEGTPADASGFERLLLRIRADIDSKHRFTTGERIGSGGIGVVLKLWDANLHRHVAKKTLRAEKLKPGATDRLRWIARFLEEAQITAQLDHPGVVPIHDIGFEPDGQIYFTMRFVRGDTLADVFDKLQAGLDDWNRTRVVSVLLRVCETMAFAHGKDVIHRDLKPQNIMVGRYGETYVMDWGLARKLGGPDLRDLRIQPKKPHSTDVLTDARREGESGLFTLDGHMIGTPCYMSPEQAKSDLANVGKPTDIYSLGAILYELLAGHPPYLEPGVQADGYAVCRWVIDGPPKRISGIAKDAPPELIAIAERAMAREPGKRYATVEAMAADLRAYLENRVVQAYRTGPISELSKWVARNRLAAGIAGSLFLTISVAGYVVWIQTRERLAIEIERGEANRISSILSRADALLASGARLSALDVDCQERAELWLAQAHELASARPEIDETIIALRNAATGCATNPDLVRQLEEGHALLENFEKRLGETITFDRTLIPGGAKRDNEVRKIAQDSQILPGAIEYQRTLLRRLSIHHDSLTPVVSNDAIDPRSGRFLRPLAEPYSQAWRALTLLADELCGTERHVRGVVSNHHRIRQVEDAHRDAWGAAIESIANRDQCPRYNGLRIVPQPGLVPLWCNAATGLWEFWHIASGEAPRRKPDGSLAIEPESGIVLVLLPSDTVWLGHQNKDPKAPFYYPMSSSKIGRHPVDLDPFFVSKYEITQAQWCRLCPENPSQYFVGFDAEPMRPLRGTQPVDSISHRMADDYLWLWHCALPTVAQWASAAGVGAFRAELSRRYATTESELLFEETCENIYHSPVNDDFLGYAVDPVDGRNYPAEVGGYLPNSNGLYDVFGNLSELCDDYWLRGTSVAGDLEPRQVPKRGARRVGTSSNRVVAGACFATQYPSESPGTFSRRRGDVDEQCGLRVVVNLVQEQSTP